MVDGDLPELGVVRAARPCAQQWSEMPGDGVVRVCPECKCKVFNFAQLSSEEARQVLRRSAEGGRIDARLFQRVDGTLLTQDCPKGLRHLWARVAHLLPSVPAAKAVLAMAVLVLFVAAGAGAITLFGDNIRRLFGMSSGCHHLHQAEPRYGAPGEARSAPARQLPFRARP